MEGVTTYQAKVVGQSPGVLMHSTEGMVSEGPLVQELRKLTGITKSKRTPDQEHRIAMIETGLAAYWDAGCNPPTLTIPPALFRACIETAARTRKEGPQVRRGLIVHSVVLEHDLEADSQEELIVQMIHRSVVAVGRQKVVRSRALLPRWSATITMDALDDLVTVDDLRRWLATGGRLIGIGDWRPDKSGIHGRFVLESIA